MFFYQSFLDGLQALQPLLDLAGLPVHFQLDEGPDPSAVSLRLQYFQQGVQFLIAEKKRIVPGDTDALQAGSKGAIGKVEELLQDLQRETLLVGRLPAQNAEKSVGEAGEGVGVGEGERGERKLLDDLVGVLGGGFFVLFQFEAMEGGALHCYYSAVMLLCQPGQSH